MATVENSRLWLAEALWDLDAVEFGEFTLGRTAVESPVYVNVRKLIAYPGALWRTAQVIHQEITALQAMRHSQVARYDLVAGVPFGGLHLATAYSLAANVPMIYIHPAAAETYVEGIYRPNQTALIIDDLATGGGSILETAEKLEESGLYVKDAYVLVDRQQGARERLRQHGVRLHSCLTLEVILNYLMSSEKITEEWYRRSLDYIEANRGET